MFDHFTELDETLVVGSCPRTPEQITYLSQDGEVGAVLSLQTDDDLFTRGLRWDVLWQLYTRLGIVGVRVPIADFDPQELLNRLGQAVAALAEQIDAGRRVYVHCNAGINRAPTTIIAYLAAHRAMSVAEASAWVQERHSCLPLQDVLRVWARSRGLRLT